MSVTFDQTKEGYVNGTSMPLAGCGPCSVASIACNISYTTPNRWQHGYLEEGLSVLPEQPVQVSPLLLSIMVSRVRITHRNILAAQPGRKRWTR